MFFQNLYSLFSHTHLWSHHNGLTFLLDSLVDICMLEFCPLENLLNDLPFELPWYSRDSDRFSEDVLLHLEDHLPYERSVILTCLWLSVYDLWLARDTSNRPSLIDIADQSQHNASCSQLGCWITHWADPTYDKTYSAVIIVSYSIRSNRKQLGGEPSWIN